MKNRFDEYKLTFQSFQNQDNNFRAQIIGDNVTLYAGFHEGKYCIGVTVKKQSDYKFNNTKLISLEQKMISGKEIVLFKLNQADLLSIFISFAIDIEDTIKKDISVDFNIIYNRYLYWIKMFKTDSHKLPESIIKGVIAELYVLLNLVIPKYGINEALTSWVGPEGKHKDIVLENGTWLEVKGINVGKNNVRISSLEQLDSKESGYLIIVELESTSSNNEKAISFYYLLNELKKRISNNNSWFILLDKIDSLGIPIVAVNEKDHYINQYKYNVLDINSYLVSDDFPIILKEDLPNSINQVSYDLLLSEISEYKTKLI